VKGEGGGREERYGGGTGPWQGKQRQRTMYGKGDVVGGILTTMQRQWTNHRTPPRREIGGRDVYQKLQGGVTPSNENERSEIGKELIRGKRSEKKKKKKKKKNNRNCPNGTNLLTGVGGGGGGGACGSLKKQKKRKGGKEMPCRKKKKKKEECADPERRTRVKTKFIDSGQSLCQGGGKNYFTIDRNHKKRTGPNDPSEGWGKKKMQKGEPVSESTNVNAWLGGRGEGKQRWGKKRLMAKVERTAESTSLNKQPAG